MNAESQVETGMQCSQEKVDREVKSECEEPSGNRYAVLPKEGRQGSKE